MNETFAHLVDHVIPNVPLRHWALTFPPPLRYLLAYDSELCTQVLKVYRLGKPWANGTRSFAFSPLDFVAKLLPMVPPPRVNHQIRYHGVFDPHSRLREQIVPEASESDDESGQLRFRFAPSKAGKNGKESERIPWADLAARTFDIDVLECPRCDYRPMRVVSVVTAPTADELAVATARADAPAKLPRRSRAPPVGQLQFDFRAAA